MQLPAATSIRSLTLNVADPEKIRGMYEGILGFQGAPGDDGRVTLAPPGGGAPLLTLRKANPDRHGGGRTAGLYHVAYLLPSRAALGAVLRRIAASGYPLQGAADHIVSEALYLADPEGNGIELYVDRPRSAWGWKEGQVAMATDPLDLRSLVEEAAASWKGGEAIPRETVIGHLHLQISDLRRGEEFYNGVLGFDVTQRSYPGALFLSAGGYHHHIGLNIWGGRGIAPREEGARGLASFRIAVPGVSTLPSLLVDQDGIVVEIETVPA